MRSDRPAAGQEEDDDLPDPDSLFRQMQSREQAPPAEDLPDPNTLFLQMTTSREAGDSGELPDPDALFQQMKQREIEAGIVLPVEDLPDPAALFLQMQAREAIQSAGEATMQAPLRPIPAPLRLPPEESVSREDKGGLFHRIKAKFSKDKKGRLDDDRLLLEGAPPVFPAPALPSPSELFRQLEAEEIEEVLADPPLAVGASTAGELPALPDLDALRAELEAEERERLDPDLLGDLSGPERFADTVSDLAFNATLLGGAVEVPAARTDPATSRPPLPPAPTEESLSGLPGGPATTPPPRPSHFPPALDGHSQPDRESPPPKAPSRAAPVYKATPGPPKRKSASTVVMPSEGAETRRIDAARSAVARALKKRPALTRNGMVVFTRQMAAMLKAGIPLNQAIAFCSEADPESSVVLEDIVKKIETGFSFSAALKEYPESFDPVYIGLVHSGELSGRLNEMLAKLADILERELNLRKRMVSVVTYPAVLLAVSILGTLGFIFFVLPQLTPLFTSLKVDLPWPTKMLLGLREVLLPATIGLLVAAVILWAVRGTIRAFVQARPSLERRLAYIPLSIPVLGTVYDKIITARVLYSLATMLEVGVTMSQALTRAECTTGNAYVGFRLQRARLDLADGSSVTECFQAHKVFPETALQLIAAGEESARLVEMFAYVARHFDEEVEQTMDAAASLLEPIIMVVMGVIVGFITIAAALPTIHLLQNFG
jgi:type IV pilus assembly protein PilC